MDIPEKSEMSASQYFCVEFDWELLILPCGRIHFY